MRGNLFAFRMKFRLRTWRGTQQKSRGRRNALSADRVVGSPSG